MMTWLRSLFRRKTGPQRTAVEEADELIQLVRDGRRDMQADIRRSRNVQRELRQRRDNFMEPLFVPSLRKERHDGQR